jgi:hypothetical protein
MMEEGRGQRGRQIGGRTVVERWDVCERERRWTDGEKVDGPKRDSFRAWSVVVGPGRSCVYLTKPPPPLGTCSDLCTRHA